MLSWRDTGSAGRLVKVGVYKYDGSPALLVKKDLIVGEPMDRYLGRDTLPMGI